MAVVTLPYKPRLWASQKLHGPKDAPNFKRSGVIVIHRRGGKTTAELNKHLRYALDDDLEARRLRHVQPEFSDGDIRELLRGRQYAHILPQLKQAKAVAWEPLKDIVRVIPPHLLKINETELSVSIDRGAGNPPNVIRLWGGDNADALRGIKLSGAGYDEFQDHNPYLHNAIVGKSLADHVGYHDRLGTIKGKNQLYKAWKAAKKEYEADPVHSEWFALWQDIDQSLRTETGATLLALKKSLADDRKEVAMGLMTQALFDQEWYLSPEAAIEGAIWGAEMSKMRAAGRIVPACFDPMLPVDTDWDLGFADFMTIWFSQSTKWGEVRLVDFYANQFQGFDHYANVLAEKRTTRGFVYGRHYAPHDIEVHEISTGKSRRDTAKGFGIDFEVVPRTALAEGINAVRLLLPRCYFEDATTEQGREGLSQYRWKKNETTNEFTKDPVHDWASHYADAFRGLGVRHQVPRELVEDVPDPYNDSYTAGSEDTSWMGM